MLNLNNTEIAHVSGALYSELLIVSAIVTMGYLVWEYSSFKTPNSKSNDSDAYDDAAMIYLTHGHCA